MNCRATWSTRRRIVAMVVTATFAQVVPLIALERTALATMPGENGRIAFSLDKGSGGEIYTIEPDSTDLTRLTHLDGNAIAPEWSPDGSRIAFWLEGQGLYTMAADGSDLQLVTAPGGQAAFTPDGEHLLYARRLAGIFLVRADGSDAPGELLADVSPPDAHTANPEMSPDGQTVTFNADTGLFAVDADGSDLRMLVSPRLRVTIKHDWSPDGNRIVFTPFYCCHEENPNIWTIGTDGTGVDILTHARGSRGAGSGCFSPDGQKIVFRMENLDRGRFRILTMNADGSDKTLIVALPFQPTFLDWGAEEA